LVWLGQVSLAYQQIMSHFFFFFFFVSLRLCKKLGKEKMYGFREEKSKILENFGLSRNGHGARVAVIMQTRLQAG